jgi:Transposase IS66 family
VGIMQADAFAGFKALYDAKRQPAPIIEAACWSHGRRKFFDLAKLAKAPIAIEAVRRIDELFEIERAINGMTLEQRVAVRQEKSKPLVADLEVWLRRQRVLVSSKSEIAKAINYSLNRWEAFTRFLDDGRICLSNNAAERAKGKIGPSPVPTREDTAPPLSILSLSPASSMTSIPRLGSPTCWHACRITQQIKSRIFCRGIGKPRALR